MKQQSSALGLARFPGWLVLKLAILAALIWISWPQLTSKAFTSALVSTSPGVLLGVAALFLFQAFVAAIRWRWVLKQMGYHPSVIESLKAWLVGQFASQALPAVVGGDAARVVCLRRYQVPLSPAAASVFVDRLAGFIVLVVLSGASLPVFYARVVDRKVPSEFLYALTAAAILIMISLVGLRWLLSSQLGETIPAIKRIKDSLRLVPLGAGALSFLTVTGMLTFLTLIVSAFLIGNELDSRIDFALCFAVLPIVTLLTFVPISIAGWGVREVFMVGAFGLIGVPAAPALAMSVKLGLANLALGLLGGLVWLLSGIGKEAPGKNSDLM